MLHSKQPGPRILKPSCSTMIIALKHVAKVSVMISLLLILWSYSWLMIFNFTAKSDAVYAMVKDLQSRGIPIDGKWNNKLLLWAHVDCTHDLTIFIKASVSKCTSIPMQLATSLVQLLAATSNVWAHSVWKSTLQKWMSAAELVMATLAINVSRPMW